MNWSWYYLIGKIWWLCMQFSTYCRFCSIPIWLHLAWSSLADLFSLFCISILYNSPYFSIIWYIDYLLLHLSSISSPPALLFTCAGGKGWFPAILSTGLTHGETSCFPVLTQEKEVFPVSGSLAEWLTSRGNIFPKLFHVCESWGVSYFSWCTASVIWMRFMLPKGRIAAQTKKQ